jgi:hypothetical protein
VAETVFAPGLGPTIDKNVAGVGLAMEHWVRRFELVEAYFCREPGPPARWPPHCFRRCHCYNLLQILEDEKKKKKKLADAGRAINRCPFGI